MYGEGEVYLVPGVLERDGKTMDVFGFDLTGNEQHISYT